MKIRQIVGKCMTWKIFKTWHKKFEEKKMEEVLVQVEKVQAPIPIPKPDLSFG